VRVDNRGNPETPPDGVQMDYILFGGLYRDVFLHVTDCTHLTFPWGAQKAGVRLTTPSASAKQVVIQAESTVRNDLTRARECTLVTEIRDRGGTLAACMTDKLNIAPGAETTLTQRCDAIASPHLWSPDDPYLYQVFTIIREGEHELDRMKTALGIRWVKFDRQEGFFLNGKGLKLVGANRHQTWPFVGGAVPNGLHRRDAEQLKAMGVNWVRLSHYPHDPDFLDALDELGLMALEEPPTWMQQGSAKWMANLQTSFRSMIRRDRNHPCVIVWGTCINHQGADERLVRAAIEEDPSRERGQATLPTPMNFVPLEVSGNGALPLEHTGHNFPTQRGARATTFRPRNGDRASAQRDVNREYRQAQRHWEQVNAAYLKKDNAGLAVWCMYDYNTFHNVNEPGMVWHGVCDLFRIPKFSYWWHKSELTVEPMTYIVRIDDTHAAVFSNCEQVRLWQDDGHGYQQLATQSPDTFFIGPEGKPIDYALHHPPYHFAVAFNAQALKAEGLIQGEIKATSEWKRFGPPVALVLEADRTVIDADGADLSRILVTAVDADGTAVDTCSSVVSFDLSGLGQLIGENPVKLRAGKMIVLAQSGFIPGKLTISARADQLQTAQVTVEMQPVAAFVDMPAPQDLPARQPTRRALVDVATGGTASR
jgi:beta-galactosidase